MPPPPPAMLPPLSPPDPGPGLPPAPAGPGARPDPKTPLLSGWPGGKFRLRKTLLAMFPPHACYVEPFCGACWLLFGKSPSRVEVINDLNGELINLYQVVRDQLPQLLRKARFALKSRAEFERKKAQSPASLSPVQRAWRYYYLFALCFGGKTKNPSFCISTKTKPSRANFATLPARLELAHARLANVVLENDDHAAIIRRYDRPHTFFYLDPPYPGADHYYEADRFGLEEARRLAHILAGISGKFLLTINDNPAHREIFARFHMTGAVVPYTLNRGKRCPKKELIISNYQTASSLAKDL